ISSGSRNSSTYLMGTSSTGLHRKTLTRSGAGDFMIATFLEAIPADLLHGLLRFAEHSEKVHLLNRILLADLGHSEAHVDENPVADHWHVVLQKAQVDLAAYTGHLHGAHRR